MLIRRNDRWVYAPEHTYTHTNLPTVMPHSTYTCDLATSASKCQSIGKVCVGYGGDDCSSDVVGYFVADRVTVAERAVPTMAVGVATTVGWPAQFSLDGILGLSWNQYNQGNPSQLKYKLGDRVTHHRRYPTASNFHPMSHE